MHDLKIEALANIADIRSSNVDKKSLPGERRVRLCNYMDVYANDKITKDLPFMEATATAAECSRFRVEEGDVLITRDSETPDDIGVPAVVVDAVEDLVCGYHVAMLKPRRNHVFPSYLAYQLKSKSTSDYYFRLANGSTRYGLTYHAIAETPVRLPPLPEQRLIAEILDTVDEAIRKTEQIIAKLEQVKQGLLNDLLTRGIDDNGELRDPDRHPEQFKDSELGRIPREWEVRPISGISHSVTSGSRGWAAFYADQGARFVRIGNLTREHINMRFDRVQHVRPPSSSEGKRTSLAPGDLLISVTADLGIIGVVPSDVGEAYVNQHIALVKIDPNLAYSRWIGHYLAFGPPQRQIRRLDDSGAKAGLNLPTVRALPCALPDMPEQRELARRIDTVDEQVVREKECMVKLRFLKQGLMDDLLTGRVRVTAFLQEAAK